MLQRLQFLLDRCIPEAIRQRGGDEVRHARLIIWAALTVAVWGPFYGLVYLWASPSVSLCVMTAAVAVGATLPLLRWTGSIVFAGNWLTLFLYLAIAGTAAMTGGPGAPGLLWSVGVPVVALALVGPRSMAAWLLVTMATLALFFGPGHDWAWPDPLPAQYHHLFTLASLGGLTLMLLSVTGIYGEQTTTTLRDTVDRLQHEMREHRATQDRLRRAERLEALGRVVAGVGHELNNPLSYVLTNLELLDAELDHLPLDPVVRQRLRELSSDARLGGNRIHEVVRNVGVFARRDTVLGPVDTREVMSQSLRLVRNQARHHAHIVEDVAPVPLVRAHEAGLGRVLINLLINAADAMPVGRSDENEIRVTVRPGDDDDVVIAVSDTGSGIPAEDQEHIFEPFFTTKEPGRGTGLGLAISHELVSRFGGRMEVRSEVGRGSTFTIHLPAAEASEQVRTRSSTPPSVQAPTGARRILVVDDDEALLRAVRRVLRDHDVVTVANGREAIDTCERHMFDVVLCDLMMPDATGMEIYRATLSTSPHLAERFVFMTGGAIGPEARAFIEGMGDRVIEKPFEPSELRTRVAEAGRPSRGAHSRSDAPWDASMSGTG